MPSPSKLAQAAQRPRKRGFAPFLGFSITSRLCAILLVCAGLWSMATLLQRPPWLAAGKGWASPRRRLGSAEHGIIEPHAFFSNSDGAARSVVGIEQQISPDSPRQQLAAKPEAQQSAGKGGSLPANVVAVQAGAGMHGFVKKEGPLEPRKWQGQYKAWRQARIKGWTSKRQRLVSTGQPVPQLQAFTGCQVFVNHLYKIIYVRHAKTASSSVLCYFNSCHETGAPSIAPSNASTSFTLLKDPASNEELARLWKEYFVVTFVRNTYQRAVSSYRMMMRQLMPAGAAAKTYSWDQFCADPGSFVGQCMRDARCRKKGAQFVLAHIQPQQECIVADAGGWAVDFIGRTEHIDEDLSTVLQEIEKRRPAKAPPIQPLQKSLLNVNGRGCNETAPSPGQFVAREQYCNVLDYYQGQHAACYAHIQRSYPKDVQGLQFGAEEEESSAAAAGSGGLSLEQGSGGSSSSGTGSAPRGSAARARWRRRCL